jgi:hypothetical protein
MNTMLLRALFLLLALPFAYSQISAGEDSPCDRNSKSASAGNASEAQTQWITQFTVNTFYGDSSVIGGPIVPGILQSGIYNGTHIDLIKYFNGTLNSTNVNGSTQALNLLDDEGMQTLATGALSNTNSSHQ